MTAPLVKICGISEARHAKVAVEAGAELLGLVFFARSHRNVTVPQATEIVEVAREAAGSRGVKVVGLFVNEEIDRMNEVAREVGLDIVQLSGDETPDQVDSLEFPYIATVRASREHVQPTESHFESWIAAGPPPLAVILDTHVPGIYGGTGTVGDWDLAAQLAKRFPMILAGGLEPDNARNAIERVQPYAVDVSSGVETDRRKDSEKIRQFIEATKLVQAAPAGGDRT